MSAMLWLLLGLGCSDPIDNFEVGARRAIIVVADGARIDEFNDTELLSAIHAELAPQAAVATHALNSGVPLTVNGHAELLSGRRQSLGNFSPGGLGVWRSDVPTLFEALTHHRDLPDTATQAVGNTVLLSEALESRYPNRGYSYGPTFEFLHDSQGEMASDAQILGDIRGIMETEDTHLLFANLHLADATAHAGGDYPSRLSEIGEPLTALWRWIESTPPYAGNTLLVVVADHGRHRWGEADDWFNHGDQCNGCRAVPLLVLGPGVAAGETLSAPVTLSDVAASVAWWLDIPLPHADGVVVPELFADPPELPARGALRTAASAEQRWETDPQRRSSVWAGDTRLSSDDALHAEAPVMLDDRVACWRELVLTDGLLEESRWTGLCAEQAEAGWARLSFPVRMGAALWRPSLAEDSRGRLWIADTTNFEGYPDPAAVRPRLLRQAAEGWDYQETAGPEVTYPLGLSMTLRDDETAWVVFAASDDAATGRDSRHVELWSASWPDGAAQRWTRLAGVYPPSDAGRLERPALWTDGAVRLAALSWPLDGGIGLVLAEGSADGTAWDDWTVLAADHVLGHISPQWAPDGALWWASAGDAEQRLVCRHDQETACTQIDALAIDALVVDEDGAWISAYRDGVWQPERVAVP